MATTVSSLTTVTVSPPTTDSNVETLAASTAIEHPPPSEVLEDIHATAYLSFDVARRKQLQTRLVNA